MTVIFSDGQGVQYRYEDTPTTTTRLLQFISQEKPKETTMLFLKRKVGESIHIGDKIVVHVNKCSPTFTMIGIEAPGDIPILRSELRESGGLRIAKLSTEAFSIAKLRGHLIQWNQSELGERNKIRYGSCINRNCCAWIAVDYNHIPTSIAVSGPAVALNCPACEEDCC